jgi:O-antigen/teichoic acid export membrane protein
MKGPIARATLGTGIVLGIRLGVLMGTLLIVARMLGAHDYGIFAGVAALAVLLGTVAPFGTHLVMVAEVSRDPRRGAAVLPWALAATAGCGSVLLIAYLAIGFTFLREYGIDWGVLVALGVAELLVNPLLALSAAEHQGRGHVAFSQVLITTPLFLRLVAAAGIWLLGAPEPLAAYCWACLGASLATLFVARQRTPSPWPALSAWRLPSPSDLRHAAGYAALSVSGASSLELDKVLALKLLPSTANGLYAVGARIMGALVLPVIAMLLSAMPRLFREHEQKSADRGALLQWLYGAAALYSVVLASALWLAAPVFVPLFGDRFEGLDHALRWFCVAIPAISLRMVATNALMTRGRPYARAATDFAGMAALAVLGVAVVPQFGLPGLAIALTASETFAALLASGLVWAAGRRI